MEVKVWIVVGNKNNTPHEIGTITGPEDMPELLREMATQIEQHEAWWRHGDEED